MSNPLSTVLQTMGGKTVTLGWDAVVAYNAAQVNELFAQQFVANVRASQNFPPITDSVPLAGTGVQIDLANLTLGPPLISFSPEASAQEAIVEMDFVAGDVVILESSGNTQYVSAYQAVVPGDQYALRMVVSLLQTQGVVTKQTVYVDLEKGSTYEANLLPGTSAAVFLGQYFQTLFQRETKGELTYDLGGMNFGSSENLTPVMFEVRTQVAPGSDTSDGAVLLFVATTYNEAGGTLPGSDFPYLIPDSYGAAVVVASKTLFGNIMQPYYQSNLNGSPQVAVQTAPGTNGSSYLSFTGGGLDIGVVKGSNRSYPIQSYWTGSAGGLNPGYQAVTVPYQGLSIQPENDLLSVSWPTTFSQRWTLETDGPHGGVTTSSTVDLTLSASFTATPMVAGDVVSFAGSPGTPGVTFPESGWWSRNFGEGGLRDEAAQQIASSIQPVAKTMLQVQIPQVNAFAVSHLFFPQSNAISFSKAYVPGDLALFGAISPQSTAFSITPLQSTIAGGETVQLAAQGASGTVTWTINPQIGTISQSGLYTAPVVPGAVPVVVTARASGDTSTAVVVVVPSPVAVSPAFSMVFPHGATHMSFVASVVGGGTAPWSISPDDGSVGTVDSSGVYTLPASMRTGVATATITATAEGGSAQAMVALVNASFVTSMSPAYASLGPNATRQFTPMSSQSFTYTVLPAGMGSVDGQGNYTAPSSVPQPSTALVVAEMGGSNSLVGIAVVMLAPATS